MHATHSRHTSATPSDVRTTPSPVLEQIFPGESAMAKRMRELDWAATSLGPVENWPQSLLTTVSTCLDCAFPIVIWWGPELTILYNDEYVPVLGPAKHPAALGQPCAKVWAEIWDVIGPMMSQVMERGEATRSRDLMLHIDRGYPEEAYFSFSYSPIRAEHGKVGGIFCPCIETTQMVIGDRRLRTLRDLATACLGAESESAALQAAATVFAGNLRDIPFALLYRVDESGSHAQLEATSGIEAGAFAAPRRISLDADSADRWALGAVARSGTATVIETSAAHGELPMGAWTTPVRNVLIHPVLLPGQDLPRAILVAAVSPMRALDEDYSTFYRLIATQIASALADARALEEERRRAAALAEIDRAKTAFFSNVSHEFRTPLTLMLGPLEDALANVHGVLPEGAAESLSVAHRNSLRLLKLVNTLLDFSRIEAGRTDASYELTDLAAFTAELASVFRSAIEKARLQLIVDCPQLNEPVYVDREMWEKVVLNLLSNAFKFTFEGTITVTLRCKPGHVELRVSDSGVGIPQAELPQIFHRFHRVKNARSRTHEGTGIGLALVQELVRLHGGDVAVESQEGRGTTFSVTIPTGNAHLPQNKIGGVRQLASTNTGGAAFVQEALRWLPSNEADGSALGYEPLVAPRTPADGEATAVARRARILVADDNADMRDYLRRLLGRTYDLELLPDGGAALERIRAELPDLVLADVMMPRLDGFGLLAAIRADDRTRAVPVILLSARAGEEARIEGLQAGADAYLTKPFSARDLEAQISSQLQLAQLRHESQQALRYRSEQVATLLSQAPLGVFLVDADFRIRDANPIALPAFGHFDGGVEGRDFDAVIRAIWEPAFAEEVIATFHRTLETGEPHITPESARLRIDRGVTEYYEWRTDRITLPEGKFGVVCYFRDISAHVRIREELRDADRRKDEFLATLAHELRNPLATLKNGVQILKVARDDREALDRTREMMERQLGQIVRLIDDLLEVSRITYGKIALDISRVDLGTVIHRSIEMCGPMLEEARHELTISVPADSVHLDADSVRLSQVLANLLNNACKFTPPGGKIAIKAICESAPTPRITISVLDNGIGIPAEMLPRIFDLFVQSDRSLEKSQGGLGIGLTLVRRLVELHHGTVEVRSPGAGQGSEFLIHLPWAGRSTGTEARREVVAIENRASPVNARRILVVDDNRDSADSLAMLLSLHDDVSTAYDGREAIEKARELKPHVVLLDIAMPQMSGYEVARELRALPGGADMLLVALTGFGQATDKRKAEQGGFDAHLTKPVDLDALIAMLEKERSKQP